LEDAVKFSEREQILIQLITNSDYKEFYIRIPLYDKKEKIDTSIFNKLYENGFRKFVFPKIQKASDFDVIISEKKYSDLEIILLVETARFFLEVKDVLLKYENIFSGIGIGSHDFMSEVGGFHNFKNLEYVRLQILYLARMINVKAIDIASMELKNEEIYRSEITDGFRKGYDAKFFIHPWQINIFKSIFFYSDEELNWAKRIKNELTRVGSAEEFNPVVIDGQIIERPHLAKAEKIIKYYETK
jgi:citrate lyase beta subunit